MPPTTTRPARRAAEPQARAPERSAVEEQRQWALTTLLLLLGAGLVAGAAKRRTR